MMILHRMIHGWQDLQNDLHSHQTTAHLRLPLLSRRGHALLPPPQAGAECTSGICGFKCPGSLEQGQELTVLQYGATRRLSEDYSFLNNEQNEQVPTPPATQAPARAHNSRCLQYSHH